MFKGGLALILVLTLAIKISFGHSTGVEAAAASDPELEAARIEVDAFLRHHGFTLEEWWGDDELRLATAHRGECRLLLGPLSPIRWSRDLLHRLAPPDGRAFFVFQGSTYDDQPRMRSWLAYFWRKTNVLAGHERHYEPLFGVVALNRCNELQIPWTSLRG